MTDEARGTVAGSLGQLAGRWSGTNGFRLMPTDDLHEAPAAATITTAAGGYALTLTYEWVHAEDGPQDGVLLVGSPEEGQDAVTAAWGDSWHQKPELRSMTGTLADGRLELSAEYGGGWGWTIQVAKAPDDGLSLTMENVIPEEHATDEIAAGPYPVMVGRLRRDPKA